MANLEKSYNQRQEEWRQQWVKNQISLHKNFSDLKKSSYVYRPQKKFLIAACVTIAVIFITLLVIGSIYDQQITKGLSKWALPDITTSKYYDPVTKTLDISSQDGSIDVLSGWLLSKSVFASIVDILAAIPIAFVAVFVFSVFFWNGFRIKHKGGRITLQVFMVIIPVVLFYLMTFASFMPTIYEMIKGYQGFNDDYEKNKTTYICISVFVSLVLTAGVSIAAFLAFKYIKKETMNEMLRLAIITIIAGACTFILTGLVLKHLVNRERYRNIYAFEQVAFVKYKTEGGEVLTISGTEFNNRYLGGYTPWYQLADNKDLEKTIYSLGEAERSFPSGHTVSTAAALLPLLCLPFTVRACNTYKTKMCLWTIVPFCIAVVIVGRMAAAAHYLTDTLFALLITAVFVLITYILVTWTNRYWDRLCKIQIYPTRK